jgi:ABC-2 type transport system permease protein
MRIFIASYIFIDALHMTVFANNCWWLPIYINRGDLDYYLTKPVSTLFFLSLREFAANSFLNLIIASSVLGYIISQYPVTFGAGKVFVFICLLVIGCLLYFFVHLIFLLSVFWTQSPRGFGDVFFAISHTMERPDQLFKGVFRFIFLFILPFSLMASYPAKYLLEDNTNYIIVTLLSVTIAFFFITQYVWRKGLKVYSSASS